MNSSFNTIIYLESYVESTVSLPPELQRILNTIKALDERCLELSDMLQQNVNALLALPPVYLSTTRSLGAGNSMDGVVSEEYVELSRQVQLAQQAYDLIEMHAIELDKQIEDFEADLRATGQYDGLGGNGLSDMYLQGAMGMESVGRGRTPKLDDWPGMATPTPEPSLPPLPQAAPSTKRGGHGGGSGAVAGGHRKRMREPEPEMGGAAGTGAAGAAAAVTPVPMAAGVGGTTVSSTSGGREHYKRKGAALLSSAASADEGMYSDINEQEMVEGQVGFMSPAPVGFKDAAPQPQAPGRFLYEDDINPDLAGRHAELFWPDDGMWYLIEIQEMNPMTKLARIVYTTGEVEELDLQEIARDMHMTLIPPEMYN